MISNSLIVPLFLCVVLQFTVFKVTFALEENRISTCKTSEYYGTNNVELICSNDESLDDIFANASTTDSISCLDNKAKTINSISFTNCAYPRAPIHLFNYFPLQTIDLKSTSLERLDKYDFVDVPHLTTLIVANNHLRTIPAKLFQFTPAIESVDLSRNQITVIDPQAFNRTQRIKFLSLSRNNLTEVSKTLFDTLPNLESLYLVGNSIKKIDPSTFVALTRLDALELDRNQLEVVTTNMFAGLWRIFRLDLSSNNINRIESRAFSALGRLLTLQLNSNAIDSDSIQPGAFDGLRNVFELEMKHNKLTTLRNRMFDGITGLQYLSLRGNRIVTIEPLAFDHADLHNLDLSLSSVRTYFLMHRTCRMLIYRTPTLLASTMVSYRQQ